MFASVETVRGGVDALLDVSLDGLGRDELLDLVGEVEVQRCRWAAVDHRLIAELDSRGVAAELGVRDTKTLLAGVVRLSPGEAAGRVRAAGDLGPRRAVSGEVLPPLFPAVAAAVADGVISDRHAAVITRTVDALPVAVAVEHAQSVEVFLTEQAAVFAPNQLQVIAARVRDTLDPDGTLSDTADHERRRELRLRPNSDGSGRVEGTLTPWAYASLRAVLDPLAKPTPTTADGISDTRTVGQRQHDALHTLCERLLRSGTLPDSGGTPATLLITMTVEQLQDGTGLATSGSGTLIPVAEVLRHAGEASIIPAVLNRGGRLIAVGHGKRLATPTQRLALAARDGGCSHPGCTIPPDWCQAHHLTDWRDSQHTTLDDLTLVCAYHHLPVLPHGWDCTMINHIPHWRPPPWLDPDRKPRRNSAHHLDKIVFGPTAEGESLRAE